MPSETEPAPSALVAGQPVASPADELIVIGNAGTLEQEVRVGRHRLLADEPKREGGNDAGPTPYDFLLAALGSCTAMTLRIYATAKKWPLAQVQVRLRRSKVHAADCASCETLEGKLDHIDLALELHGPLTEEQRARLLEIAGHCPVHRTLTSEIEILSRLV